MRYKVTFTVPTFRGRVTGVKHIEAPNKVAALRIVEERYSPNVADVVIEEDPE